MDDKGPFLSIVKSILSFRRVEVQWDAGVCQGKATQHSSQLLFELPRAAPLAALMYSALVVSPLFQLCPWCRLLPALFILRLP